MSTRLMRAGPWPDRRMLGHIVLMVTAAALAAGLASGGSTPQSARANGVPTLVSLAYIDGLSNWGPEDATGELELSFAEGYARLDITGLQLLTGKRYQGWIVNSESNDAISIGTFNADANGTVAFGGTLPPIADFGFDLFIITVEPEPDDAPQPTTDRSIGGRFSLLGEIPTDGGSSADAQSGLPSELPDTGDATLTTDLIRVSLLLGAIALSIGVGIRVGRGRA